MDQHVIHSFVEKVGIFMSSIYFLKDMFQADVVLSFYFTFILLTI